MKSQNTAVSFLGKLNFMSALLLVATSICYYQKQQLAFVLFFSTYFLEFIIEKKWNDLKIDKKRIFFLIMAFFVLLAFIYYPFEENHNYFEQLMSRRFALFGFAFIGFFGVNKFYKINYFLNTFIITSVVTILIILFYSVGINTFINDPNRFELFRESRILLINSHMVFNIFLNISIVGIWKLLTANRNELRWWSVSLYTIALLLILGTLSMTEGRIGLITGIVIALTLIIYQLWIWNKTFALIAFLMLSFGSTALIAKHQRMSEQQLKEEPRKFLWKSAWEVIKQKPALGWGISDGQNSYDTQRVKNQSIVFKESFKNIKILHSHNQFLQTTIEFGLFGLLLLLFIYAFPIIIANHKVFAFFILLPFISQSVFDVVITGLNYATIFGFVILILLRLDNFQKQ